MNREYSKYLAASDSVETALEMAQQLIRASELCSDADHYPDGLNLAGLLTLAIVIVASADRNAN